MTRRYARAAQAFEDFTGRKPTKVTRTKLQSQDAAGWKMGPAVGIAYEAVRDGERAQYFHEFAKKARPDLVARDDGKQLFLTGGNYTVTERGIEDMPELFVVNPSARAGAKKGKSMAATKRNSKGRFVKRGASSGRRKRRTSAARQVVVMKTNPAPRKRRRAATKVAKRRTYRRNPSGRGLRLGGLSKILVPAMGAGGGAVLAELFMGYMPIPAAWKTGIARHITKGAVGLAAGYAVAKFFKQKQLGMAISAGAVVIATHDAIKEFVASRLTMLPQGGFGQYVKPLPSQFAGMGYMSPARLVNMGQYVAPLPSQFAGASALSDVGGETDYQA